MTNLQSTAQIATQISQPALGTISLLGRTIKENPKACGAALLFGPLGAPVMGYEMAKTVVKQGQEAAQEIKELAEKPEAANTLKTVAKCLITPFFPPATVLGIFGKLFE